MWRGLGPVIEIKMTAELTVWRATAGPCGFCQQLGMYEAESLCCPYAVCQALEGLSAFLASWRVEGECLDWRLHCLAAGLCWRPRPWETPCAASLAFRSLSLSYNYHTCPGHCHILWADLPTPETRGGAVDAPHPEPFSLSPAAINSAWLISPRCLSGD